jgi:hypothetical protein
VIGSADEIRAFAGRRKGLAQEDLAPRITATSGGVKLPLATNRRYTNKPNAMYIATTNVRRMGRGSGPANGAAMSRILFHEKEILVVRLWWGL